MSYENMLDCIVLYYIYSILFSCIIFHSIFLHVDIVLYVLYKKWLRPWGLETAYDIRISPCKKRSKEKTIEKPINPYMF